MNRIFIAFLFLIILQDVIACDICGCSAGSYFTGPNMNYQRHFAGVRYSFRTFHSSMKDDPQEFSKDLYQTTELWGGVRIGKRVQLTGFLPYNINQQVMDGHTHSKKGIGDATIFGNYKLVEQSKHQVWAGVGVKLPTGEFEPNLHHHPMPSANVQPGTGTTDFILNAGNEMAIGRWNISNNINYKINGQAKGFRFGNRLHISSIVSRGIDVKKNVFTPFAGINIEYNEISKLKSEVLAFSSGYGLFGAIGADVNFGRISTGVICQLPVVQNYAANQTDSKVRGMLHVTYLF